MTANNQKSFRTLFKTSNILKENKELLLAEKIKFKLEEQLTSLSSSLEIEVYFTPYAVELILIESTSNLSKIPQELIFESAKIAEKIAPKTKDIKIYSKLKDCSSQLELSLNEEFAKHSKTFQKIDLINRAKTNERSRKRIATINVLRRERLSVELNEDLGNQELIRRKLYLEERLTSNESLQKFIVFISIFVFGGSSAITQLNPKKIEPTSSKVNKTEILNLSQNKNQKIISKVDNILDYSLLPAIIFLAVVLAIFEVKIFIDTAEKKEQLSIIKYALEMNKDDFRI